MRAVIQRVRRARVTVDGESVGAIGPGLLVLVAAMQEDDGEHAKRLASKVTACRVFSDANGKMNLSIAETSREVLAVSQFTLAGDVRRGNRPSFVRAMEPSRARVLFEEFCDNLRGLGLSVQTGRFRAHMEVELVNDGPVTLLLDTARTF